MSEVEAAQAPVVLADLGKEALRDLLGNLTQAKAFVLEQAPEFCQQLVMRDSIIAFTAGGIWLAVFIAAAFFGNFLIRAGLRKGITEDRQISCMIFGVVSGLLGIGSFIAFSLNLCQGLYVILAPKVYLVEQLMRMVK